MPRTKVVFYRDDDGSVPLLEWLDDQARKVQDKCTVKIERLAELGHELRRPEADLLRDAIYELRVGFKGMNYRMLYFFSKHIAVISHGLTKEKAVPPKEIDLALKHKGKFEKDPEKYTHKE